MVYLIYLVLLVIALGVLIKFSPLSQRLNLLPKSLSHEDLLTLVQHFHYKPKKGVCFGFTIFWAQDVALLQDEDFYKQLDLIKQEKEQIVPKIAAITHKIKHNQPIEAQDYQLLEIKSFIEVICMAQSPSSYEDVYARPLTQLNINRILAAAQQGCAVEPAKHIFTKTFAFESLLHAPNFFSQLSLLIKKNDHVAVVVSNESHTVGLKKAADYWLFIDINKLYAQSTD